MMRAVAAAGLCLGLMACMTSSLFEKREYEEHVSSLLMSADKKTLVFIGKDYHYVFDAPEILVETLEAPFRSSVEALVGVFDVSRSGKITGSLTLRIPSRASEQHKRSAAQGGYRCRLVGGVGEICLSEEIVLVGTRYAARPIPDGTTHELNQNYRVSITADEGPGAKILLTPITVAVDGVLVIGAIPLFVVGVSMLSVACADHGCR